MTEEQRALVTRTADRLRAHQRRYNKAYRDVVAVLVPYRDVLALLNLIKDQSETRTQGEPVR